MVPHISLQDLKDIGALLDALQLILMVAVTYVLLCLVRMMRQLHALGQFWFQRWWDDTFEEEAPGDPRSPMGSQIPLPSTPVAREWAERVLRCRVGLRRGSLYWLPRGRGRPIFVP
jgi:hypothetical protein